MIANRRVENKRAPLLEPPRGTYERAAKARLDMTISEQEVSKYANAPREKEYRALRKKYGERPVTRESRLEPETILNLTSWRRALTDDLPCGMIHPRDAVALLYFPAPNASVSVQGEGIGRENKESRLYSGGVMWTHNVAKRSASFMCGRSSTCHRHAVLRG